MKLSINRDMTESGTRGLQKFGALLIEHLQGYGVKLVDKNQKSDIHLSIISGFKPGSKNVLRLDGVYYDVGRLKSNNPIKNSINRADGIIYQSEWCKKFVEGMLKVSPKRFACIHNGTKSIPEDTPVDKYGFDKIFVACANWRTNKRLASMVTSFVDAIESVGRNVGFCIVGKPDHVVEHPNIRYFGHVADLRSLYKSADYMCHICHLDACPNSVVEGLHAGVPVLCNNIGGTPEIVGDSGIILPLDKPFDFKPIQRMEQVGPLSVNGEILTKGMIDMMSREWEIDRPDLNISVSAKKYYKFFERILSA